MKSRSCSWLVLGGLLLVAAILRIRIPLYQTGHVEKKANHTTTSTLLNNSVHHDNNNNTETMARQPQSLQDLIDPTSPLVQCGKLKCFFPSRSNAFKEGYLIAQQGGREDLKQNISIWKRVFDETAILAQQWEADYGLRHFLRGNYTTQSCTPELAAFLNQRVNNNNNTNNKIYVPMENLNPKNDDKNLLFVQPVWTAPPRHVIFGCKRPSRVQAARTALPHTLQGNVHVDNNNNFVTTIRQELNATLSLMKKEPRLLKDFQILLDTDTGRIYHLDLDRCVRPMKLVGAKCEAALKDFVELAIALVQEQQQRANENATNSTNL